MAIIDVEGDRRFDAPTGVRLVLALEDAGIDILHRCGGQARCTTCRIEILAGDAGPMTDRERAKMATLPDLPPNTRLSCQVLVGGDLRVRVLNRLSSSGLRDAGPRPADTLDTGPMGVPLRPLVR
jgi:ferredoxin